MKVYKTRIKYPDEIRREKRLIRKYDKMKINPRYGDVDFFGKEVKDVFLLKMEKTQNTISICREMGIPWSVFYAHFNPNSPHYDPVFASAVETARKKFGYHIMEDVLLPMAEVKKPNHFNYTIATLRAFNPEYFDRSKVQIGIVADKMSVKWGDGSFDPLKLREEKKLANGS